MTRLSALLLLLLLSGCLLPESYDAEVFLHADGRFEARFDGEVLFVPARRELKDAGEAAIAAAFADTIRPMAGVTSAEPLGDGRWRLRIIQGGSLQPGGNALPGPDRFLIINLKQGEAVIGTPDLSPRQQKQLAGFGRSAGRLCLRTDAPVLAHNADSAPTAPGGCYSWALDVTAGGRVDMRLKM